MYNILICDDEKDIVSALSIYLSTENYNIFTAYTGQEALDIVAKHDIHLILMDIMMPIKNGYEAAKMIRSLDREDAKEVPIIAMTANAFEEDKKMALASGMNDHVAKPIDMNVLLPTIMKYM